MFADFFLPSGTNKQQQSKTKNKRTNKPANPSDKPTEIMVYCYCAYFVLQKEGDGGGGVFLACEDCGRMFRHSFPACTLKKRKKKRY